jgi:hypothetical protein
MPDLPTREAVERITRAVEAMGPDDLLDFHNELFPRERKSKLSTSDLGASDRRKILEYLSRGLEIEEFLDLWNVAFPGTSHVYYDDETEKIHYSELSEAIGFPE